MFLQVRGALESDTAPIQRCWDLVWTVDCGKTSRSFKNTLLGAYVVPGAVVDSGLEE